MPSKIMTSASTEHWPEIWAQMRPFLKGGEALDGQGWLKAINLELRSPELDKSKNTYDFEIPAAATISGEPQAFSIPVDHQEINGF